MKKPYPLIFLIFANVAPVILCAFYHGGGSVVLFVFPAVHICLFLLNYMLSDTWPQIIIASLLHSVVSLCTIMQIGWLYLHYISYDGIGAAIVQLECIVDFALTLILGIVSFAMFYFRRKDE